MNLPALLLQSFEVFARCASSNCYEALWQKCPFWGLSFLIVKENACFFLWHFARLFVTLATPKLFSLGSAKKNFSLALRSFIRNFAT